MPSPRWPTTGRVLLAIPALVSRLGSLFGPGIPALADDRNDFRKGMSRRLLLATTLIVVVLLAAATPAVVGQLAATTSLVSVASDGTVANYPSVNPSISADGRYVVFDSEATNLVPNDTNSVTDIFVHDRQTRQTVRASVASDGSQGNGFSQLGSISANGRYVVFESTASNLVPDSISGSQVFVRDLQTGQTERVSVLSNGEPINKGGSQAAISADGRYVVFRTQGLFVGVSSNICLDAQGADARGWCLVVHDRQTGQTTVAVAQSLDGLAEGAFEPSISADGRYVVFTSDITNLVPYDTNGKFDVFIRDRQTGSNSLLSVSSAGTQANGNSALTVVGDPGWSARNVISADGRYVVFVSEASNLVAEDTNAVADVFVRDRQTGQTSRVSAASDGAQANGRSMRPAISADGRYVTFESSASNLVSGDTNATWDVFVHDRQTGQTTRVSVRSDAGQASGASGDPAISADGRYVVFLSGARNLVSPDSEYSDIFVRDRGGSTATVLIETGSQTAGREYGKSTTLGDPIAASNGAYHFRMPPLALGGPMGLTFQLLYRSDYARDGTGLPETFWWTPNAQALLGELIGGREHATVFLPNGNAIHFARDAAGNWAPSDPSVAMPDFTYTDQTPQRKYVLEETTDYAYLLDPIDELVYLFQKLATTGWGKRQFRIARILDRNGNQLSYTYASATDGLPTRIEDGLGRSLELTYASLLDATRLQAVTDQGGRQVVLSYDDGGTDNPGHATLRSYRDPLNQTTTFTYAGALDIYANLIASLTRPRGNIPLTNTYAIRSLYGNPFARVASQQDGLNNTTSLAYDAAANTVTATRPDGAAEQYEHYSSHGLPRALTDPAGRARTVSKNAEEQVTAVADRLGAATSFTYHAPTGKLASITNAKGGVTTYTYAGQDQSFTNPLNNEVVPFTFYNLARVDYPDGAIERFTYDANGNALTRVDRGGYTWAFSYHARGQVLTRTNPAGGVATFTYDARGNLASRRDSDTGTTTYSYDALNRLAGVTHPDGTSRQFVYDANDRVTRVADERANATTFSYDANSNLATITDPAGNLTTYTYDALDRPVQVADRLGRTTTYTYDALGRLAARTDPSGVATTFGYDPRGWVNRVTRGGKTWQTGRDPEGVLASRTNPLGQAWTYQTDSLGFLAGVTDPLGGSTTLTRDALSRLTGATDPLGRTTTYTYDARGLLTGVAMPAVGTATYQRDSLGALTRLTDLDGQFWNFAYSPMGRLQAATDPLDNTRQYSYDSRGRLGQTTYPDGATLLRTYDAAGNLTGLQYAGGPSLQYSYDALDRLVAADGLGLSYDAEGRVVNTQSAGAAFGAGYDADGRLASASYNNGAVTVTYTYDATGRLSGVSDSLTATRVSFSYDDAFRLVGVTRSNGVNATLTWDGAGRLTRIQDGTVLDLQYALDGAGQVVGLTLTAPLDPQPALGEGSASFSYDAASQVSSAGYAYDRRGRQTAAPGHTYTWDGASRLVGVDGVSLSYNGLGDVVSRTEAGQTTRYAYNAALGLRPIVAEQDGATGQFTRYYVWTPAGRLLYLVDAASGNRVSFYHFDRAGSTLALTDASGAVADAYAYTPYGRLLGHEGSSPQPFTFVGQYGVRQEGASGALYQMRARYYDAHSGRFLSREPIWPAIANPRQVNPYQYALANPVRFVDPGGTDAVPGGGLWGDPMSPTVLKFGVSSLVDECLSEALLLGNPFQLFDCRELLSEATEEEERVEELMNSQSSKRLESGRVPQDGGWGGTPSSQLIGQRQTATKLSQQPLAQTDKVLTQTSGTGKPQQSAAPRRLLSNEDWMQIESYERRAKEKQAKLEQFRAKGLSGLFDPEEVAALRQNLPEAEFMQLAQDYAAGLEADVDRYNQRIDEILNQR